MASGHRLTSLSIVALISLGVAGCAVDQDKEVAQYRKVLDGEKPTTRPVYESGQPLSLVRALQLATTNNEQLASQGETYVQALIAKDRAAAAFWPTISLTPTYFVQDKSSSGGTAGTTIVTPGGDTVITSGLIVFVAEPPPRRAADR